MKENGEKQYKIFLSYRGSSEICTNFIEMLYKEMRTNQNAREILGNVYYSEDINLGNFVEEIENVMPSIEYFVIPYFKGFFKDFLNQDGSCNKESVTRKEIESDFRHNCKNYVVVYLDDSDMDAREARLIFGENANKLIHAKKIVCPQNGEMNVTLKELAQNVTEDIINKECEGIHFSTMLNNDENNIHLMFKNEAEDPNEYSIYYRLLNCKKITFLNFAGTSLISADKIADGYRSTKKMQRWFAENLLKGKMEADVILVNPLSDAAKDAALYKMYPNNRTIDKDEIIFNNLEQLLMMKFSGPDVKLNIYLTEIAIPYGIFYVEYERSVFDYMKVDLYAPVISSDDKRPSFYIKKDNNETRLMYEFFVNNLNQIMNQTSMPIVRNIKPCWMLKHEIVHRGKLNGALVEHTFSAVKECISQRKSVEVDLLVLADDSVVVWRDESMREFGFNSMLSELDAESFTSIRCQAKEKEDFHSEMMFLSEFLSLVDGEISVLFEIKSNITTEKLQDSKEKAIHIASCVMNELKQYRGRYSIHSSNPYALEYVKSINSKILCGQITLDMRNDYEDTPDCVKEMHKNRTFDEIFSPDFISCKISDIHKNYILSYCYIKNIPLLGWVVKDDNDKKNALCCDGLIVEG